MGVVRRFTRLCGVWVAADKDGNSKLSFKLPADKLVDIGNDHNCGEALPSFMIFAERPHGRTNAAPFGLYIVDEAGKLTEAMITKDLAGNQLVMNHLIERSPVPEVDPDIPL